MNILIYVIEITSI